MRRIEYMDTAKGIAMLAVILGHIEMSKIRVFFYIFHLPIFFIISGFFFHYQSNFKNFLIKKTKTYLVPYIFSAAIITIFDITQSNAPICTASHDLIRFVFQYRYTTLWFLSALFVGEIIFWVMYTLFQKNMRILAATCSIVSACSILYDEFYHFAVPWNIDTAFIIQIFIFFGFFLKKYSGITKLSSHKIIAIGILVFIGMITTICNYILCGQTLEMHQGQYGIFPFTIIAACTTSLAVILISTLIKIRPLQWLGKNTMVFFAFHQAIAQPIMNTLLTPYIPVNSLLGKTLTFVGIILICSLIHYCITAMHLGFLIGKKSQVQRT